MSATLGWILIGASGIALALLVAAITALAAIDRQVTRDHWGQS